MSPRQQALLSAFAAPAFAFIAAHRVVSGSPCWAALWAIVAIFHTAWLIESVWQIRYERARKAQIKRNGGKR